MLKKKKKTKIEENKKFNQIGRDQVNGKEN